MSMASDVNVVGQNNAVTWLEDKMKAMASVVCASYRTGNCGDQGCRTTLWQ
jgi:hypothetical protein